MGQDVAPQIGPFSVEVDQAGIATVVFDRPPVNAVSVEVYTALAELVGQIESSPTVKVVVLTAPLTSRAWCGGADLNDFLGIDSAGRAERYDLINRSVPRLYELDRPVIAAINGHVVGVGMILAGLCDIRIGADSALLSCPEVDYGLVAGSGGLFSWLKVPEGIVREMYFTGGRITAERMGRAGFLNHVVPREEVQARASEMAAQIASKDLATLRRRKRASNALEGRTWREAYLDAQHVSIATTGDGPGEEGVRHFLGVDTGRPVR